ncbi:hypothetical protein CN378_08155 [Bacillus sp. AFS015802]|uniref:hypothetical protein n=1 Tax=Bacillus sp. AFS015802 TaxID=2033486 RepID=UPI000BF3A5AC|nr:hypothetical protein [Bacillus sp. AFS015802]PFA68074.1 hypothetical protein CN378_08155 [Bacillus sp. AFS015802]
MKKLLGLSVIAAVLLSGCGEVQISINKDVEPQNGENNSNEEMNKGVTLVDDTTEDEKITDADKQKAIIEFINEDIQKVAQYEVLAFESLASVSGVNYTDDQTLYQELTTTTIPSYEKALEEAKSIEGEIPELEEMTDRIVEATQVFYDSLMLEKKAIEDQDEGLIEESNAKIEEYYRLVEAYHSDMKLLAEQYDVTYQVDELSENVDAL